MQYRYSEQVRNVNRQNGMTMWMDMTGSGPFRHCYCLRKGYSWCQAQGLEMRFLSSGAQCLSKGAACSTKVDSDTHSSFNAGEEMSPEAQGSLSMNL